MGGPEISAWPNTHGQECPCHPSGVWLGAPRGFIRNERSVRTRNTIGGTTMDKRRVWLLVFGLGLAAGAPSSADDAPWQRMLKGDDARKAADVEKQVEDLQAT